MTIAKWIDEGSLSGHTTPGGHRRVAASDLISFLERTGMQVPENLRTPDRPRVLVVHRDPEYLGDLSEIMTDSRDLYEYRGTTSGVDALLMIGEWQPQVILLDLDLPDVDGVQICQRFSDLASDRDTRVVALVHDEDGPTALAARRTGVSVCAFPNHAPGAILDLLPRVLNSLSPAPQT